MTSSPPVEAPRFRGKTLTPESPRPVHISEPSNIPVLERQIDPFFNLMSTHMEHPHALRDLTALDHDLARSFTNNDIARVPDTDGDRDELVYGMNRQDDHGTVPSKDNSSVSLGKNDVKSEQEQSNSSLNQIQSSSLADQHSTSMASLDILSAPAQIHPTPISSSFLPFGDSSQHMQAIHDPSQDSSMIIDQATPRVIVEVDNADQKSDPETQTGDNTDEDVANGGVNYQTLLDNISPSSATALSAAYPPHATSTPSTETANVPPSSSANAPSATLPPPVGLPPRPPPQEKPAIHPNYMPGEDIRSYHYPQIHLATAHANHSSQPSNSYRPSQVYAPSMTASAAPGTSSAPNGLPPPPTASFQQPLRNHDQAQNSPKGQQFRQQDMSGANANGSVMSADSVSEAKWTPELERKYEDFLGKERIYVSEGLWDRFPPGSRLFVGNLPTESVSKRDLFLIFYKYGSLAQISIKQAYGFIQYLDEKCCYRALQAEQGLKIKDRNMHLEISKPQKNARNAAATADGDNLRASYGHRSRSPDYGRGPPLRGAAQRFVGDRYVGGVFSNEFRDEPRRRDDYRPVRSPSPRGFRGRDEYRGSNYRSPDRYYGGRRSRSRSPPYGRAPLRYRSPSPRRQELDEDAALPIARRNPRDVPDVQMILVEELDRAFVAYIEKSFRDRTLRCEVMLLPRVSLAAVVKRQILEGVPAIVKLYRSAQITGKIPLQVFDRSRGTNDVRFEEYEDLEAHVAAELVVRAKAASGTHLLPQNQHSGSSQVYTAQYPTFNHQASQQQPSPAVAQPNIANLITSLDGPALQKLLGAMQQNPQTPQTPQQHNPQQHLQQAPPIQTQDLAALFGNVSRQHATPQQTPSQPGFPYPSQQASQQPLQQYPFGAQGPSATFPRGDVSHERLQQATSSQYQQPPQGQQQQQHVQNIMEQLAKWKQ